MKKGIAIRLLKNKQARQLGIRLLRNPRVQRAVIKQVTRRLGKR